ncbi:MAG: hypothetical protein LC647_18400 [Beggiatoa sp.]|nr:hypothetical protein [Beggiatoa sp.]
MADDNPLQRDLEAGIHRDLAGRQTYSQYLCLDTLLSAQRPLRAVSCSSNGASWRP